MGVVVWPMTELEADDALGNVMMEVNALSETLRRQRLGATLARDPAYNPNLTLNNENFALADPPRVSLLAPWFGGDGAP